MEEVKEVKEVMDLVTEGGYRYITKDENGVELKIRNSIVNRRLTEDNETFEEYKIRLKMAKEFVKSNKKGTLIWPSKRILTDTDRQDLEKNPKLINDYRKLSLGTYDKKKLEQYIQTLKENETEA